MPEHVTHARTPTVHTYRGTICCLLYPTPFVVHPPAPELRCHRWGGWGGGGDDQDKQSGRLQKQEQEQREEKRAHQKPGNVPGAPRASSKNGVSRCRPSNQTVNQAR